MPRFGLADAALVDLRIAERRARDRVKAIEYREKQQRQLLVNLRKWLQEMWTQNFEPNRW